MKAKERQPKDRDLDERPFGDSHFTALRRDVRPRAKPHAPRRDAEPPLPGDPSRYAWHDGVLDDLDPRPSRRSGRIHAGRGADARP